MSNLNEQRTYGLPAFPVFPDLPVPPDGGLISNGVFTVSGDQSYTINSDGHYTSINIENDTILTIDVGSGNRKIRVGNLNIRRGDINMQGSGTLTLYVESGLILTGDSEVNRNGNANDLTMYYKGAGVINPDGRTLFKGQVYAQTANINITASGGITGHIVTGGSAVEVSGNASAYVRVLYAPNAKVSFKGSGHFFQ